MICEQRLQYNSKLHKGAKQIMLLLNEEGGPELEREINEVAPVLLCLVLL